MNGWTITMTDEGLFSHWGPMILVLAILLAHTMVTSGTRYAPHDIQWPTWERRGLKMLGLTAATFFVARTIDWKESGAASWLLPLFVVAPLFFKLLWYCWDEACIRSTTIHKSVRPAIVGIFFLHFVLSVPVMIAYS